MCGCGKKYTPPANIVGAATGGYPIAVQAPEAPTTPAPIPEENTDVKIADTNHQNQTGYVLPPNGGAG